MQIHRKTALNGIGKKTNIIGTTMRGNNVIVSMNAEERNHRGEFIGKMILK